MKKYFVYMVSMLCLVMGVLFSSNVLAQESQTTVTDIKLQLIESMKNDGYLSNKMANEVASKYIKAEDSQMNVVSNKNGASQVTQSSVSWSQYLSWVNLIKVIGVICILVSLFAMLKAGLWNIIKQVPTIIYQVVFLGASLFGTFYPEKISVSESFYIALFCIFANVIIVGWIVGTYQWIQQLALNLVKKGIPVESMMSLIGMIYFAFFAILYQSSIIGFFAAICLSGVFSFGMTYMPGVLSLSLKENMLGAVIAGHMIVLAIYAYLVKAQIGMEYIQYFNAGIQYYCTIALGVALLIGSSPFYKTKALGLYVLTFIVTIILATMMYSMLDLKVIGSIVMIFSTLFVIEWITYIGFQMNMMIGSLILGGVLYGVSLLFEKFGHAIILTLN